MAYCANRRWELMAYCANMGRRELMAYWANSNRKGIYGLLYQQEEKETCANNKTYGLLWQQREKGTYGLLCQQQNSWLTVSTGELMAYCANSRTYGLLCQQEEKETYDQRTLGWQDVSHCGLVVVH